MEGGGWRVKGGGLSTASRAARTAPPPAAPQGSGTPATRQPRERLRLRVQGFGLGIGSNYFRETPANLSPREELGLKAKGLGFGLGTGSIFFRQTPATGPPREETTVNQSGFFEYFGAFVGLFLNQNRFWMFIVPEPPPIH